MKPCEHYRCFELQGRSVCGSRLRCRNFRYIVKNQQSRGRSWALRPNHMYIRYPLPVVAGRGGCDGHHWDEELRNYDTDEDVFNEIRMEQQSIKLIFIDQALPLPLVLR